MKPAVSVSPPESSAHRPHQRHVLAAATRLHLGQASSPPLDLAVKIHQFASVCASLQEELVNPSAGAATTVESSPSETSRRRPRSLGVDTVVGLLAVDATPKLPDYDLVAAVQQACTDWTASNHNHASTAKSSSSSLPVLQVVPVTPWGTFVLALNALLHVAKQDHDADSILFCSAETVVSSAAVQVMLPQLWSPTNSDDANHATGKEAQQEKEEDDTLVVGAVLPGHDYHAPLPSTAAGGSLTVEPIALSGVTTPWNTLALWNVRKLALTGFLFVSEGLLTDPQTAPSLGVEEVATIAVLQQLLGTQRAKAKLVPVPGVAWDATFAGDNKRKQWHDEKMKSKQIRAARQLELLNDLTGLVYHF